MYFKVKIFWDVHKTLFKTIQLSHAHYWFNQTEYLPNIRSRRILRLFVTRSSLITRSCCYNQYYEYIMIDMLVKEYRVDFNLPLKASYLQRFWLKKKHVFRLIIFSRPKKRVFLDFSCFSFDRHVKTKLFRTYQNFISSTV